MFAQADWAFASARVSSLGSCAWDQTVRRRLSCRGVYADLKLRMIKPRRRRRTKIEIEATKG
jgi:hypothetical protein